MTAFRAAGRIIIMEGMPGAGKTTCIRRLSRLVANAAIVPQLWIPPSQWGARDDDAIAKRYLTLEEVRARRIAALARTCAYVFVDRSYYTTLAYAYARGLCIGSMAGYRAVYEAALERSRAYSVARPSRLVLLFVDIDVSLRRRAKISPRRDFPRWFDSDFLHGMARYYRQIIHALRPQPLVIDTSALTIVQTVAAIRTGL